MGQFASNVLAEIRSIVDSSMIDARGRTLPFSRGWTIRSLRFDPRSNNSSIVLVLSQSGFDDVTVVMRADDFPEDVWGTVNSSTLSDTAFGISIFLEEAVFSWEPECLQGRTIG
jgi:hypothetical protein